MPPRSQAQRSAMYAAAAGKSTLGIPKSVGQEFTAADSPGKLPQHVRGGDGHKMGGKMHPADSRIGLGKKIGI